MRNINVIAAEISKVWPNPNPAAVPYLVAMHYLETKTSMYGVEDAKSIVLYFLSNATTFRGEDARRLKAELKTVIQ